MPLRETASTVPKKKTGFTCGVKKLLETLEPDDRAWLEEQLAGEATHAWISSVLKAEGLQASQGVVGHHRTGRCSCGS